jgi:hypothetical protein
MQAARDTSVLQIQQCPEHVGVSKTTGSVNNATRPLLLDWHHSRNRH